MMGKDCERILKGINLVKDELSLSIQNLAGSTAYPIVTTGPHSDTEAEHEGTETKVQVSAVALINPVISAMTAMQPDIEKMGSLKGTLYTSAETFNNGYGSPWTELTKMKETVEAAKAFGYANPMLDYVGTKAAMLSLMNLAYSACVDAKWALIVYNDYIQRGYDCVYNGKLPSIEFDSRVGVKGTGNVDQAYDENVNVPAPSIDPF